MNQLEKLLLRAEHVLLWAAVVATGSIMLLTSADALLRYAINAPVTGAYEITEKYLMPASVFLGMTYAYRGGAFIRVTFLVDKLPAAFKQLANYIAWAISLLCCGIFVVATVRQAVSVWSDGTTLATINIPAGPAYWLAPVGFFALTLLMLIDLPKVGKGEAMLFAQDAPNL